MTQQNSDKVADMDAEKIGIDEFDCVHLTQELIRESDATQCLNFVKRYLESLEFECEILCFKGVHNLFAHRSGRSDAENVGAACVFFGHVDVVPAGNESLWKVPPFSGELLDGSVYGRGSVDMKGGLACFLSAIKVIYAKKANIPSISLIITCDEEGVAEYGTKAVLEYLLKEKIIEKFDFAIIGEPTSFEKVGDHIKIGGRGSLNVKVCANGRAGHVAYSDCAINPIDSIIYFFNFLKSRMFDGSNSSGDSKFFERSNIEITSIDVDNPSTNVIPEKVTAAFNIRFNDQETPQRLIELIENLAKESSPVVTWNFVYDVAGEPFLSSDGAQVLDKLVFACESVTGSPPKVSTRGANSDARFLKNLCPFAEIGLLSKQAHQTDEHVSEEDLAILCNIFYKFLKLI
jgi:succinyl-diaminopimelate desuccinylase